MQPLIEILRHVNQEQSHREKPELHSEEIIHAMQLKDSVFVYGQMYIFSPYGKNFVILTGVDVYNLYKI